MGRLIITNAITVNGAFEAPSPETWFTMDADSLDASLAEWYLADAMVLGRKTYQGLAAVWPQPANDPNMKRYADRMNSMPKYVASRTLDGPLDWNATLIEGDLAQRMPELKDRHQGNLIVSGAGELAHDLLDQGVVDELWFWVNPHLWSTGPRIYDGVGPVPLRLVSATTYPSGVVWLAYRPAPDQREAPAG